jgi:hypothetical protein
VISQSELELRVLPMLGWDGQAAVEARAWSTTRLVICSLDEAEHQRRSDAGHLPVTDPLMLRCSLSSDSGFRDAPSPVTITGAIAARRTWQGATANLGGFSAFGSRVAVLPPEEAVRPDVGLEAAVEGYGIIALDGEHRVWVVHHPDTRPHKRIRTWVHRLVEEIIYNALLTACDDERPTASTEPPSCAGTPVPSTRRGGPV